MCRTTFRHYCKCSNLIRMDCLSLKGCQDKQHEEAICRKEIDPPSPLLQAYPMGSARAAPQLSGRAASKGKTPQGKRSPITPAPSGSKGLRPSLTGCRGGRPRREGCRDESKNDLWNASRFAGGARLFETRLFQRARLGIHMRGAFANYRIQMPPWDLD